MLSDPYLRLLSLLLQLTIIERLLPFGGMAHWAALGASGPHPEHKRRLQRAALHPQIAVELLPGRPHAVCVGSMGRVPQPQNYSNTPLENQMNRLCFHLRVPILPMNVDDDDDDDDDDDNDGNVDKYFGDDDNDGDGNDDDDDIDDDDDAYDNYDDGNDDDMLVIC